MLCPGSIHCMGSCCVRVRGYLGLIELSGSIHVVVVW